MIKVTLIIASLFLCSCFSEDQVDPEVLRAPLKDLCKTENQIGRQLKEGIKFSPKDSLVLLVDSLRIQIDSLGAGLPPEKVQRLSTKIPECVKLYEWRKSHPRPKKKIEYIKAD